MFYYKVILYLTSKIVKGIEKINDFVFEKNNNDNPHLYNYYTTLNFHECLHIFPFYIIKIIFIYFIFIKKSHYQ